MNREEIAEFLPHREPMLLVDSMEHDGDAVVGYYTVRGDEFFLQGHFPGRPIVPGVILCEIMGQASTLLVEDKLAGRLPFYTGIDRVRFRAEVHPGDTVCVRSTLTALRGVMVFVEAEATVAGRTVCNGRLMFKMV